MIIRLISERERERNWGSHGCINIAKDLELSAVGLGLEPWSPASRALELFALWLSQGTDCSQACTHIVKCSFHSSTVQEIWHQLTTMIHVHPPMARCVWVDLRSNIIYWWNYQWQQHSKNNKLKRKENLTKNIWMRIVNVWIDTQVHHLCWWV